MINWMIANHAVVASLASLGTLVIWTVYLHIFLQSHRRQRKPKLLISMGEAHDLTARCLITNMSEEAVYVQTVVVDLRCGEKCITAYITDAEDIVSAGNPTGWQRLTRQGPLKSGTMADMGTFEHILDYLVRSETGEVSFANSELAKDAQACDISILGIYGSEDLMIGATRRFELQGEGKNMTLKPVGVTTRQIASYWERRRLTRQVEKEA